VYPALAVAQALRDARSDVELDWIGGVRGFERRIVAGHPLGAVMRYHQLAVRSLRSAGLSVHTVLDPARLAASAPQAWWLLGPLRPAAIFTTGGYLALPLVLAARARGIPTLLWEGNVQPGRATRAVGRFATRVAVSFPPTLGAFPVNGLVSGTPIRSFAGIGRAPARASFGLSEADRLLLAFGGSQAVTRLNGAVTGALPRLLADWHVLHLAGENGMPDALAAREALSPVVAYWTSEIGGLNKFFHTYVYKDLAERSSVRKAMAEGRQPAAPGAVRPIRQENKLLIPAAFSPLR
jgi:UDP-N-acetylglucosamine--N-acetylmuramyl-(pentapeptide) pyrophosphoryl-undecaprenol N-acetylglucosamine transferase